MSIRHLLNISDLSATELRHVLNLSTNHGTPLSGLGVALIFEKPSNRTRHSMEMAVVQLGGHPVYTRGEEVGLDVRESVEDVTKILGGYHAIIAARVFKHSFVERMAAVSSVPVINMLSDWSHPLQALADVFTMEEKIGSLSGKTIAWVGDYNNVARSLGEAVCLLGGVFSLGCPTDYSASNMELARLEALGGSVTQTQDPNAAVQGAHVVHTDTWISMGQEEESSVRRTVFGAFMVTEELMAQADPAAFFMHCMPAHRGEEVSAAVMDGPRSLVITQGHHRMTAARGALAFVMGG